MSTVTVSNITKDAWVQITNGEDVSSVFNLTQNTLKIWQGTSAPDVNADPLCYMGRYEERIFFGLGVDTEYIFAIAVDESVDLTSTPSQG